MKYFRVEFVIEISSPSIKKFKKNNNNMDTTEQLQKTVENTVPERPKGLDSLRVELPQASVFAFIEKFDALTQKKKRILTK